MDGFTVEPDRLSELVSMVRSAADQIGAATGRLREASESQLGHEDLDSAGQEFQERWEFGVSQLREATQRLAPALDAARQEYADEESVHAIRLGDLTIALGELPDGGGQDTGGQASGSPTDGAGAAVHRGSIGRRLDGDS